MHMYICWFSSETIRFLTCTWRITQTLDVYHRVWHQSPQSIHHTGSFPSRAPWYRIFPASCLTKDISFTNTSVGGIKWMSSGESSPCGGMLPSKLPTCYYWLASTHSAYTIQTDNTDNKLPIMYYVMYLSLITLTNQLAPPPLTTTKKKNV